MLNSSSGISISPNATMIQATIRLTAMPNLRLSKCTTMVCAPDSSPLHPGAQ